VGTLDKRFYLMGNIMKIVKPYKMMFQIGQNDISRAMISERNVYNHYTNVESLECIMKTKTLLLNRIDSVNDLDEKDYLKDPEVYSLIYISCFTYKEIESIPHWFIYTKENEGVRISLELKDKLSLKSIIDYHSALNKIGADNSKEEYFSHGIFFSSSSSKWSVEIQISDIIYNSNIIM